MTTKTKKIIGLMMAIALTISGNLTNAQNVGINGTGNTPDPSAMLDIESSNKGLLVPRITLTGTSDVATISSPSTSLLIFNTASISDVTPGYYYWGGTKWERILVTESVDWTTSGNAGTNPNTNYVGTSDAQDFVFKTGSAERARITSDGKYAVGISNPVTEAHLNVNSFAISDGGSATSSEWINGGGTRFYYEPGSGNLLIGDALSTEWDFGNVGQKNLYFGSNLASDNTSSYNFGFGSTSTYSGGYNFGLGAFLNIDGDENLILGSSVSVTGDENLVIGSNNTLTNASINLVFGANNTVTDVSGTAGGNFISGNNIDIVGDNNVGFGANVALTSTGYSFAMGSNVVASGNGSFVFGASATNSGNQSLVMGASSDNTGSNSIVLGVNSSNAGTQATIIGGGQTNTTNFKFVSGHGAGYVLYSNFTETTGVQCNSGSGTWSSVSDRNLKTNITELDYSSILRKLDSIEIPSWSYIAQTVKGQETQGLSRESIYQKDIYHVGPMAQDFYGAFGLGIDDKHVTALDLAGVSLVGVKALIVENEALKTRLEMLEMRLLQLESEN